jgi:hypothetical protein
MKLNLLLITKAKHGIDGGHHIIGSVDRGSQDRNLIIHSERKPDKEPEHFAQLFAASPEMLISLQELIPLALHPLGGEHLCDDAYRQAKIDKAMELVAFIKHGEVS